jgi:hypothetical protein
MIDLNRIGGGLKLIKYIVANHKKQNSPWSKANQVKKANTNKNTRTPFKK